MSKKVIVGLGEILWDMLPSGKALGGAPANFAYHAQRLGEEGWAVSAVGDDPLGREILDIVAEKQLNNIISVTEKPTGTVAVKLDDRGVPSYNITEDVFVQGRYTLGLTKAFTTFDGKNGNAQIAIGYRF